MLSKIAELLRPIYKIKLGTHEDICKEPKTYWCHFQNWRELWLGVEETIKNAISLKKLGVEFLEQTMKG
jgi:hypothetical protein